MIACQREKFLLQRKYAYINCAYMSPLMKKVENAGKKGLIMKRKPYQIGIDDFFNDTETVRILFSKLIHCAEPNRIVVIPSASYGMANVVNNLPRKGKIIVAGGQFPSNVYPWMALEKSGYQLEIIDPPSGHVKGEKWNQRILESITSDTVMLAIGHVHWADGTLFELEKMRKRLDEVDGLLVIDGTQSVGALPFDVSVLRPDALICAGYKWLMGPYSIGLAYYGPRFDAGNPIEQNWINRANSEDFTGLVNYQKNYRDGALKYEVGEHSNFILIPMLLEALKQLLIWTPEAIQEYCDHLTKELIVKAEALGFGIEHPDYRARHLFGLQIPDHLQAQTVMTVFKQRKVSVSLRGNAIRISPHLYNDQTDMRKLTRALEEICAKGH